MRDPYMIYERIKLRMIDELNKYGDKFIIAVDFDDTVFDTHEHDWEYNRVLKLLKKWSPHAYIICWTASKESRYPVIKELFSRNGIELDAINENAPWIEDRGRKIYANVYLDDRAGLETVCQALEEVYKEEILN